MAQRLPETTVGLRRSVATTLGLVVLAAALARGDRQEDLAPQKIHVELGLLATMAGSATYSTGALSLDLAVGESKVWSLLVGHDRAASVRGAGCATRASLQIVRPREVPEWTAQAWEAQVTVGAASLEKISLDVDWKRYLRGSAAELQEVTGDHRSFELREGGHVLLDFAEMRLLPTSGSCYASFGLELKATVAEDPVLANRRIGYDLWLVDEGPGGPSTTRRWQMAGKQGEARDFDFEPLRRPFPGAGDGEASGARVDTRVFGQVRGRVQSDGSLEVALLAKREDNPSHRHWAIGGAGEKRVRVSAGETIRLELPEPTPDVSRETDRSELKRDVDHGVLSSLQERTVSLVLTARPVD